MLTQKLAEFVINTSVSDMPPEALDGARDALIDTIGCALAGTPEAKAALAAATGALAVDMESAVVASVAAEAGVPEPGAARWRRSTSLRSL